MLFRSFVVKSFFFNLLRFHADSEILPAHKLLNLNVCCSVVDKRLNVLPEFKVFDISDVKNI